ncbi:MAG: MATE family efflux transporter [Solobacterium sp.]|nr:MATE family efflux transporter [Solobacterium sp.]
MSKQSAVFTEGPITGPLIRFALPMLAAMFLQSMYGAVDLMVVGRFAGTADVSAVSTGSQLMMSVTSLFTGLAMGMTVLLGQKIGEGNAEEGGAIIGAGTAMFASIGLVFSVILFIFAEKLAALMNAPAEAYIRSVQYIRICGSGSLVIIAYNTLGAVFRGIGDSRTPLFSVAVACVCNIIGDLLFIAVFHMGTAGAAAATVLAQLFSVIVSFLKIRKMKLPFVFKASDIRFNTKHIRRILFLGLPIALQDVLVSISFLVILSIVNSLGVIISAGVGVAEKVCGFVMLLPASFSQACSAFVAQNKGAGKYDRAVRCLRDAVSISFGISVLIFCVVFFFGYQLSSVFAEDPEVLYASSEYLKAYAIDVMLVSIFFIFTGFFTGIGKTRFVMLQGIVGAFLVRIPVSYIMSKRVPVSVFLLGMATPSSSFVQAVLCVIYFLILR